MLSIPANVTTKTTKTNKKGVNYVFNVSAIPDNADDPADATTAAADNSVRER